MFEGGKDKDTIVTENVTNTVTNVTTKPKAKEKWQISMDEWVKHRFIEKY